ncbi:MAG: hypothetical protein RLZZ371_2780 [Pseudomonadota bacterium]
MPMPNWFTLVHCQLAKLRIQNTKGPAFGANREAAQQQAQKSRQSTRQQPAALRFSRRNHQTDGSNAQPEQTQSQPDPPVQDGLQQTIGGFGAGKNLRQHAVPGGVLDGVPGQHQVGQQAGDEPEAYCLIGIFIHVQTPSLRTR